MIYLGRKLVPKYIQDMALAIMNFEGYYPGSLSVKNNNPGNLKYAGQSGAVGQDSQGHAIFNTFEDGWNALINQLKMAFYNTSKVYNSGMTLYQFFQRYAEGNQEAYARYVASQIGVPPDYTLDNIKEYKS
jgi:hypothetical protein